MSSGVNHNMCRFTGNQSQIKVTGLHIRVNLVRLVEGTFFIVKIWKSVLELHMEPLWKCFGVVIMKWYEVKLNFEYWTSKFDFSHFQCPMVTHLKFEFFYNCFNIWFILSQLFVFISCYWPHVSNKTLCKCLD